jgi:hypothetical protein
MKIWDFMNPRFMFEGGFFVFEPRTGEISLRFGITKTKRRNK